jgi:hypothetical protein
MFWLRRHFGYCFWLMSFSLICDSSPRFKDLSWLITLSSQFTEWIDSRSFTCFQNSMVPQISAGELNVAQMITIPPATFERVRFSSWSAERCTTPSRMRRALECDVESWEEQVSSCLIRISSRCLFILNHAVTGRNYSGQVEMSHQDAYFFQDNHAQDREWPHGSMNIF